MKKINFFRVFLVLGFLASASVVAYYSESPIVKNFMGFCVALLFFGIFSEVIDTKKLTFFNK
jgi:hypothetical protein